ncbi:glycoside hydrolase family 2 protein [Pedobacter frigoris]|uniref:glycoside hydrolase family 2 protein n=1 Tax=Pedobacter frigoris TaxID=2571272 RepID=UPI00292EFA12|nr:glycoside hydrolase family 2 TIM barrel-domain containing protein [Pedobacter frigoris]
MKNFYKITTCLLLVALSVKGQIQKVAYRTAEGNITINRISPAASAQTHKISLDGTWQFSEDISSAACDKSIQVPGEWVMQGFNVKKGNAAGYFKRFEVPADWKNKRIKLRFDAVFSDTEIWLNDKKIATHLGGFTPFEVDITSGCKTNGTNQLLLKVKSESKADSLASASQYAVHPLGGISRKVYLIALPEINFAYADVKSAFDKNYENATLSTDVIIANEQNSTATSLALKVELLNAEGTTKISEKTVKVDKDINPNGLLQQNISFEVNKPMKWDPEHPNLYTVKVSILKGNVIADVITKQVGFRQIEVRGNRVYVNNKPIKLRGVCHHETMPLRGRSVNDNMWERDVKLFREGNVNYIRTSHYPPAEELIDACNRLGMFLEVEAPFCWAENTPVSSGTDLYQKLLVDQTLDMVNYFRSNPSVLIWSIGNESGKYKEYFKETAKLVKQFDPTRPRNFSQYGPDADEGDLEITNHHYPGPGGPAQYRNYKRPIVFDEYVHLNAYNRLELVTDPGLRDVWGVGFEAMWEKMYRTDAVLGGAIWAGIDDTFFLPNGQTVGYGTWGPLDGWRRPKPEYWHMKKIYSPVKINIQGNWENGQIPFNVENRMLFTNLAECRIEWKIGKATGVIREQLEAGKQGKFHIDLNDKPANTDDLTLNVFDARGVLIDTYQFKVVPQLSHTAVTASSKARWKYDQKNDILTAGNGEIQLQFNTTTGEFLQISRNGKKILSNTARLMVLPLTGEGRGTQMTGESQHFDPFTDVCKNRIVNKVTLNLQSNEFSISIEESYDEASGKMTYNFGDDGNLSIGYKYTLKKDINPRQWGLVFDLPETFNKLSWIRKGQWNYYPEDHIGRLRGVAEAKSANEPSGPAGPSKLPVTPWSLDRNDIGTNDFRSTKMNFELATLTNGNSEFKATSDNKQHFRVWQEKQVTKALVAGYSNAGAERFFRSHAALIDQPLKVGSTIENAITLQLTSQ